MPEANRDDPRYLRVRERLTTAILDLASRRSVDTITVSELTAHAGVSRSAFYAHAPSPTQLLADHLVSKLAPLLEQLGTLLERDPDNYVRGWRNVYLDVLMAVREDGSVYAHVFGPDGSPAVLARLCTCFERAAEVFVGDFIARLDEPVTELWRTMAVAQHVNNTVVLIESWVRTGMRGSPTAVLDTFMTLVPPWQLVHLSTSGTTSLGRSRLRAALSAQESV
ncbi:TetR/AcrR family transcriptional regulator [Actinomyces qiguomingii]|uniref:TetR/AcrR family transcriptional regulator n=1 Tax=Actinomyces qiguomingii TaxID=2057800 RepID=UPI000CA038FB|nr:TetR/AcrR family transcriptional regulator [Actinomyces qiguomingii]